MNDTPDERWFDIADFNKFAHDLPDPADDFTLTAAAGAHDQVKKAVAMNQLLGHGGFSRVYALSDSQVVKFTTDIDAMEALKRLGDRSPFFPKVHEVLLAKQAFNEEGTPYAAMVMERLHTRLPEWISWVGRDIASGMQHEGSSARGNMQLLMLKFRITTGEVKVNPAIAEGFAEAIGLLAEECQTYDLVPDLKTGSNFMSRENRHVVIADPAHSARQYNR